MIAVPAQNPKRLVDRSQPVGRWASVAPNQTLYVNNLNERLNRDELVKALKHVFGQFGKILDVICYTKIKAARGQAFIVFDDISAATKALREMQNFMFYNKPMRVSYAKTKSDVIAKRDGTFRPRPKKRKKGDGKVKFKFQQDSKGGVKGQAGAAAASSEAEQSTAGQAPNRILLIQNLPNEATEPMVSMLFQAYAGFQKVSLIPGYQGFAYVEFASEGEATQAMKQLQGFKITQNHHLHISYAPSS